MDRIRVRTRESATARAVQACARDGNDGEDVVVDELAAITPVVVYRWIQHGECRSALTQDEWDELDAEEAGEAVPMGHFDAA